MCRASGRRVRASLHCTIIKKHFSLLVQFQRRPNVLSTGHDGTFGEKIYSHQFPQFLAFSINHHLYSTDLHI